MYTIFFSFFLCFCINLEIKLLLDEDKYEIDNPLPSMVYNLRLISCSENKTKEFNSSIETSKFDITTVGDNRYGYIEWKKPITFFNRELGLFMIIRFVLYFFFFFF